MLLCCSSAPILLQYTSCFDWRFSIWSTFKCIQHTFWHIIQINFTAYDNEHRLDWATYLLGGEIRNLNASQIKSSKLNFNSSKARQFYTIKIKRIFHNWLILSVAQFMALYLTSVLGVINKLASPTILVCCYCGCRFLFYLLLLWLWQLTLLYSAHGRKLQHFLHDTPKS